MRFEVEHISWNLLLYIVKPYKKLGNIFPKILEPSHYPKIAAQIRTFLPIFERPNFEGYKIFFINLSNF